MSDILKEFKVYAQASFKRVGANDKLNALYKVFISGGDACQTVSECNPDDPRLFRMPSTFRLFHNLVLGHVGG